MNAERRLRRHKAHSRAASQLLERARLTCSQRFQQVVIRAALDVTGLRVRQALCEVSTTADETLLISVRDATGHCIDL